MTEDYKQGYLAAIADIKAAVMKKLEEPITEDEPYWGRSLIDMLEKEGTPIHFEITSAEYPKTIQKYVGPYHKVELVEVNPNIFEVFTSSTTDPNSFGTTGGLPFERAEARYYRQVDLVERGEVV